MDEGEPGTSAPSLKEEPTSPVTPLDTAPAVPSDTTPGASAATTPATVVPVDSASAAAVFPAVLPAQAVGVQGVGAPLIQLATIPEARDAKGICAAASAPTAMEVDAAPVKIGDTAVVPTAVKVQVPEETSPKLPPHFDEKQLQATLDVLARELFNPRASASVRNTAHESLMVPNLPLPSPPARALL